MSVKKNDSFTIKTGVARDRDKVESEEAYQEGREIEARLKAREKPVRKPGTTPIKEARKDTETMIQDLLKDMFK